MDIWLLWCCIFAAQPEDDFQNKKVPLQQTIYRTIKTKAFMFTNIVFNYPNWLQQKDHETSIDTRPVIVRFSFGSRSLLVRSSFVSRSSLVAYSLVYRRPNEDRTRNKRKTNERATNIDRDADEKLSATRRVATFMAGSMPFCNHKPAKCLLLPICRGRTLHFLSTLSISAANKTISSIPWKPYGSTM